MAYLVMAYLVMAYVDMAHQVWNLTSSGQLVSGGSNAKGLCLDWTSRERPNGAHPVYMHPCSDRLPHQKWAFTGSMLSSCGLCLDWAAGGSSAANLPAAEMRPCSS